MTIAIAEEAVVGNTLEAVRQGVKEKSADKVLGRKRHRFLLALVAVVLVRREALTSAELAGVVDLWLGCAERRQQEYLLQHPREALSQAKGTLPAVHDPRLSEDGNRVWKRVGLLLDVLGRMEVWLAHHGRTGLTAEDRAILAPRFERLARDAGSVAALSQDFVSEPEPR